MERETGFKVPSTTNCVEFVYRLAMASSSNESAAPPCAQLSRGRLEPPAFTISLFATPVTGDLRSAVK